MFSTPSIPWAKVVAVAVISVASAAGGWWLCDRIVAQPEISARDTIIANQVASIFRKLGVGSRAELTVLFTRSLA